MALLAVPLLPDLAALQGDGPCGIFVVGSPGSRVTPLRTDLITDYLRVYGRRPIPTDSEFPGKGAAHVVSGGYIVCPAAAFKRVMSKAGCTHGIPPRNHEGEKQHRLCLRLMRPPAEVILVQQCGQRKRGIPASWDSLLGLRQFYPN